MAWTLITMSRSGRALIQGTDLSLYSDGEPVPSALCMLHKYGWEQGLGSHSLTSACWELPDQRLSSPSE